MVGDDHEFIFKAKTPESAREWTNEINAHLQHSQGHRMKKMADGIEEPWKYDNISE